MTYSVCRPYGPALLSFLALFAPASAADIFLPPNSVKLMETYCVDCHEEGTDKGGVRFDNLGKLPAEDFLDLLNRAQEQVFTGEMPPKKKKQPTEAERSQLVTEFSSVLRANGEDKLGDKLQRPEYGNYVDHDKLFSGAYANLPGFTYDRRWLISEFLFENTLSRIMGVKPSVELRGKRITLTGRPITKGTPNLTNPFLLPDHSGVRNYASIEAEAGTLVAMLGNTDALLPPVLKNAAKTKKGLPAFFELTALEDTQSATLKQRADYLQKYADRLLREVYGSRHEALLPNYVPLALPVAPTTTKDGKPVTKAPWYAVKPSLEEGLSTYITVRTFTEKGDSSAAVVDKCQRAWFNEGLDPTRMLVRMNFVANYAEELEKDTIGHFDMAFRGKPLPADEIQVIKDALGKCRAKGDRYGEVIAKCLATWEADFQQQRKQAGPASDQLLGKVIGQTFELLLERQPTAKEAADYLDYTRKYVSGHGNREAFTKLWQTLMLSSEFLYRREFGTGTADSFGRRMMSPFEASYAIANTLTEESPDEELRKAAAEGRLNTREDYRREVERLLKQRDRYYSVAAFGWRASAVESITNMPVRKMRFFREFFGYYRVVSVFKDDKRFGVAPYENYIARLAFETENFVEHVLQQDRKVFETLLTSDQFYVYHSSDNQEMAKKAADTQVFYAHFKALKWESFKPADMVPHAGFMEKLLGIHVFEGMAPFHFAKADEKTLANFKAVMRGLETRANHPGTILPNFASGSAVARFFNIDATTWDYPATQPAAVPHRKGLLTHPAWLIAHAKNTETDPIRRGKWIREKLLAGTVPEVPITVDAVIPEHHFKTLRDRLAGVTEKQECWKCHERMNPLGLAFESFDDFGRFRTEEEMENPENLIKKGPEKTGPYGDLRDTYKTLPVNATGALQGTGDPKLDGPVRDAFDLIDRLAKSDRVRQSIIRHAFRFFLGRNETLNDSKTLIEADQAYLKSGGSFDAVIVSLLTSDSFIYRTASNPMQVASNPQAPQAPLAGK